MNETQETQTDTAGIPRKNPGKMVKLVLIVIVVVAILVWLGLWLHDRMTHVSSSDAQVAAHVVTISSRLPGRVSHFDLIEGDTLDKGDVVAKLYSRPEQLKLDELTAQTRHIKTQLALAQQQIAGGLKAAAAQIEADKAAAHAARVNMQKAKTSYDRVAKLYKSNSVSERQRDAAKFDYESARARYKQAQSTVQLDRVNMNNVKTGLLAGGLVSNPDVLETQLQIAEARQAHQQNKIDDLTVRSQSDGVVDATFVDNKEYVAAGQPIVMMHDPDDVWIQARIKETSIRKLAVGQHVDITVDAWPDSDFSGHVQVIGQAATNQFALLPDPNPSGNFTKITQRIPVRIRIDHGPKSKLAPGMMVEVHIATTQQHTDSDDK